MNEVCPFYFLDSLIVTYSFNICMGVTNMGVIKSVIFMSRPKFETTLPSAKFSYGRFCFTGAIAYTNQTYQNAA